MTKYIFLRIWVSHLYGWYLVFKNGEPICSIDSDRFSRLSDLFKKKKMLSAKEKGTFEKYLGKEIGGDIQFYEVDPSRSTTIDEETENEFPKAFYNYFGELFKQDSPIIDSDVEIGSLIYKYFPAGDSLICADLGAGSGNYSRILSEKVKIVYACDIEPSRLMNRNLSEKIKIVKCNITDLPFESDFFDFSMCNFVLEHVGNPYKVLSELIRTLKPRGKFLISVPSFNYNAIYQAKELKIMPTLNFEHLRSFTGEAGVHPWEEKTDDISYFLVKNGCEITEIRGVDITSGLDQNTVSYLLSIMDQPEYSSSNIYPFNHFGNQTMIYGSKK